MVNRQQNDKNPKISPLLLFGGVVLVILFPAAIPIGIIGFVIYLVIKNKKNPGKGKRTPLSSAQKSEYKEQPPRPRPPQSTQNRQATNAPRPVAPAMESSHYAKDLSRYVRTTTDYGARHRENAKRLLDAGLMERDEYNMQIARSRTL